MSVILFKPTDAEISCPYMSKAPWRNTHFDPVKKLWVKGKDAEGSGNHQGIDFACPTGTQVKAVMDGFIMMAGWQGGLKPPKDMGFGLRIVQSIFPYHLVYYGHLSNLLVKEGDKVTAGQVIAESGATGDCKSSSGGSGAHLHLEVRDKDQQPQEIVFV